jgi:hypothetical protein
MQNIPKPNSLIKNAIFPELVKVIAAVPLGDKVKLICEGIESGKVHQPILNEDQVNSLEIIPQDIRPFDEIMLQNCVL